MRNRLKEILAHKSLEVERLKDKGIEISVRDVAPRPRDFRQAISSPGKVNLIAEIKFASPSAGTIRRYSDPIEIAVEYEKNGAAAISLLTDKRFFDGDISQLPLIKEAVGVPILCKDFIIDRLQVTESVIYGADAILLIARILPQDRLEALLEMTRDLGLYALVEVHNKKELDKALNCGAEIIGINNRDLDTFEVDVNTTLTLAPLVPEGCIVVSESGINDAEDLRKVREAGVEAVLVGTALMKAENQGEKLKELVRAGEDFSGQG